MGAWARASLLLLSIIWFGKTNPQVFQNNRKTVKNNLYQLQIPKDQEYGLYYLPKGILQTHSASGLHSQKATLTSTNLPVRTYKYSDPITNPDYDIFDESFEQTLRGYQGRNVQTFPNDRTVTETEDLPDKEYDDYKTSETTHILGPHQIETIQSEHFHKQIPSYDITNFQHDAIEPHGEIHYHQHKHIHKHEHKQEHLHQHKQDHQHKHLHSQQHKHDHNSQHNHGHQHKHEHHQQHKHDHNQQHKHDHRHEHKQTHNHGHKHQHNGEHQHGHKHHHTKH